MKKWALALFILPLVGLAACNGLVIVPFQTPCNTVIIRLVNNGIETEHGEVRVRNIGPGDNATFYFSITNKSSKTMQPDIYFSRNAKLADYSVAEKEGYLQAPPEFQQWVTIEKPGKLAPGQCEVCLVTLSIPQNYKPVSNKVGIRTDVMGNTNEMAATAIGIWWLIDFR